MQRRNASILAAVAAGLVGCCGTAAWAGSTTSFSTNAPTPGAGQVVLAANLPGSGIVGSYATGSGTLNYYTNTNGSNIPGGTFTTGSNPGGYQLDSITVYDIDEHGGLVFGGTGGDTVQVQVGNAAPDGTGNVVMSNTTSHYNNSLPTSQNGSYFTYTFGTPINLQPNTLYGYGLFTNLNGYSGLGLTTTGGTASQQLIAENFNGTSDTYSGVNGNAVPGNGTDVPVFEAIGTAVPEPATLALAGLGMLALLTRRRQPV